ncbi:ATP-binding protein [Lachnospiraceae bacterium ZAX-1]
MGIYLNPNNESFQESLNSEIYVDKTGMITYINSVIRTRQKYICVSRPRRFGKSMSAEMLAAYYSCGCDSKELFEPLLIASEDSFAKHLNQYNVIFINMQEFLSNSNGIQELLDIIRDEVMEEIQICYPQYQPSPRNTLKKALYYVEQTSGKKFVIVIDEWDCIIREYADNREMQKGYLDFLRDFLKDKGYIALAYMTGILPIKKYGTHSALNMFDEFSMTDPRQLAEYVGFTENEVMKLCEKYQRDFDEAKRWYDGYQFVDAPSVYSPRSVVTAMLSGNFNDYWNQTETFEALKIYIEMNFDGLKDTVVALLAGERKKINIGKFSNDMATFINYNDVLALLIHLGYLGYDFETSEVFIPNKEITDEYVNAIEGAGWTEVIDAITVSDELLQATWNQEENIVAAAIQKAHMETSHLTYSDENALSYTVSLAYYSARQYYTIIRELPSGKGFADLVFLPRRAHTDKPTMIVELKWNQSAKGAISQIKNREYVDALKEYKGSLLLVGVNYDKKSKEHRCQIETFNQKDF